MAGGLRSLWLCLECDGYDWYLWKDIRVAEGGINWRYIMINVVYIYSGGDIFIINSLSDLQRVNYCLRVVF